MSEELNLPWTVYFFNEDGKYHAFENAVIYSPEKLKTDELLRSKILMHNRYKLEIRICDCLDYCIIHFKEGRKVFP